MSSSECQHLPICAEKAHNPARPVKYETITIPGLKTPYPNCGDIFKILKCTTCEYKTPIKKTCDRPECSECWQSWAAKEATRCVERFNGYKRAYKEKRNKRLGNARHVILSPPQKPAREMVSESGGIEKLKKKAIDLAKKNYLYGGSIVYHHYRILKRYQTDLKALAHKQKRKLWDLVREDELGLGDWRDYLYVAPHFHLIAFGAKVNGGNVYKETGWYLESKPYISSKEKLHNAIFYQLAHATIRDGRRALTWFGTMSYNKLSKKEESVNWEVIKCPECGAEMEFENVIAGRLTGYCVEATAKITTYRYFVNDPPRLKPQITMEAWK